MELWKILLVVFSVISLVAFYWDFFASPGAQTLRRLRQLEKQNRVRPARQRKG